MDHCYLLVFPSNCQNISASNNADASLTTSMSALRCCSSPPSPLPLCLCGDCKPTSTHWYQSLDAELIQEFTVIYIFALYQRCYLSPNYSIVNQKFTQKKLTPIIWLIKFEVSASFNTDLCQREKRGEEIGWLNFIAGLLLMQRILLPKLLTRK